MLGPEWKEGCPGCSFVSDHVDGAMPHLTQRDVSYVAVSRGPISQIEAFKKRRGWNFKWVSSNKNDFNFDYHVSFTKDELAKGDVYYNFKEMKTKSEEHPGLSVFYKDENGDIFHTYSTYGRGLELTLVTYQFLDLVPKGRDEEKLERPMSWVRHHDKYENNRGAVVQIA